MVINIKKDHLDILISKVLVGKPKLLEEVNMSTINYVITLNINPELADEIRDLAGEELQRIGFDENYKLTNDGQLLDEIVDIFLL